LTKNLVHLTDWVRLKVKHAVNCGDGFTRFDHTATCSCHVQLLVHCDTTHAGLSSCRQVAQAWFACAVASV
jgi:hypothetical protein